MELPEINTTSWFNQTTVYADNGEEILRYEFETVDNLERFFVSNFNNFARQGFSTKAIGTVLLVFKYSRKQT